MGVKCGELAWLQKESHQFSLSFYYMKSADLVDMSNWLGPTIQEEALKTDVKGDSIALYMRGEHTGVDLHKITVEILFQKNLDE